MNVVEFEKSFRNIDLEFDETMFQFMDECQCTYGFLLCLRLIGGLLVSF